MTRVLIIGGRGFLGRNLAAHLGERADCEVTIIDREESPQALRRALRETDIVFHLAGVNRPRDTAEFETGNVGLTKRICQYLRELRCSPKVVFSSSIQADLPNPYGSSKARAEDALRQFALNTGAKVRIYRLKNLFGKWCRPNYNSVTATFCHNIANGLPITISDVAREIELSYVDDVVAAFAGEIDSSENAIEAGGQIHSYRIRLGDLAGRIQAFHEMRDTLALPDFSDGFNRALYATYLSYLPAPMRKYALQVRTDPRGSLAELVKQRNMGQIFVSRTKPGVTRGNHYHHTKTEKFLVLEGSGVIRMRNIEDSHIDEYLVSGDSYCVVDIPPGTTHSITNVASGDLVTLFWSSEIFNPDHPDTYFLPVELDGWVRGTTEGGA